MEDLPDDFQAQLTYRVVYGEAAGLAEIARFANAWGKAFASGLGANVERIQAELTRRLRPGIDPELIKLAVEDAIGKRPPRW